MLLRIEDGILLKPYTLPWREEGYTRPPGWTPDATSWIKRRANTLEVQWRMTMDTPPPRLIAEQQAETEYGRKMKEGRHPWPGWVPVSAANRNDKKLRTAYRKLFIRMNPEHSDPGMQAKLRGGRDKVLWPPDGEYTYANGRMEAAADL